MKQLTLAAVGFERYAKTTRRAGFLAEMERVVPWSALCALIEPFYPKPGNGRPPVGVERIGHSATCAILAIETCCGGSLKRKQLGYEARDRKDGSGRTETKDAPLAPRISTILAKSASERVSRYRWGSHPR
jgi:hypothetical protein